MASLVNNMLAQARPKFNIFLRYAKVELTPPKPSDIPQIKEGIGRLMKGASSGTWKQFTVREAWLNTLVAVEVYCWFFVGECIGKRQFVGYNV